MHVITYSGTAYAVLALTECDEVTPATKEGTPP